MEQRVQELCDAYVLGALEDDELGEMRSLLARGEAPVRETVIKTMRNSEEAAALLAWGAPQAMPPIGLRRRVLDAVAEDSVRGSPHSSTTRVLAMSISAQRSRFAWPVAGAGWAAAAALAIAAFLMNGRARNAEDELADTRTEVGSLRVAVADRDRVLTIIGSRDARTIRLVTSAPEAPQFRAYWSESAGLVLAGSNVPTPRAGRTMQLWIVPKQGAPISAGVFVPTDRGEVLLIAAKTPAPDLAQALAISDEPRGGSAQPTMKPAWVGALND